MFLLFFFVMQFFISYLLHFLHSEFWVAKSWKCCPDLCGRFSPKWTPFWILWISERIENLHLPVARSCWERCFEQLSIWLYEQIPNFSHIFTQFNMVLSKCSNLFNSSNLFKWSNFLQFIKDIKTFCNLWISNRIGNLHIHVAATFLGTML